MSLKLKSVQVDYIREYVKKQVGWSPDDYELLRLSDCTVLMKSGKATFKANKYPRPQ
jgi:hypothetical protein